MGPVASPQNEQSSDDLEIESNLALLKSRAKDGLFGQLPAVLHAHWHRTVVTAK
jgi:hypothetical protein